MLGPVNLFKWVVRRVMTHFRPVVPCFEVWEPGRGKRCRVYQRPYKQPFLFWDRQQLPSYIFYQYPYFPRDSGVSESEWQFLSFDPYAKYIGRLDFTRHCSVTLKDGLSSRMVNFFLSWLLVCFQDALLWVEKSDFRDSPPSSGRVRPPPKPVSLLGRSWNHSTPRRVEDAYENLSTRGSPETGWTSSFDGPHLTEFSHMDRRRGSERSHVRNFGWALFITFLHRSDFYKHIDKCRSQDTVYGGSNDVSRVP